MFRKTAFVLVAIAALGSTALTPTSASAWSWYDGRGGFHGVWHGWDLGYYYPAPIGGSIAYCARRHWSYDPASGTFLGNDGFRHLCH
jgi:hypothetical protein